MTANMQESLELAYEAGRKAGMLEVANRQEIILGLCTQLRSYAEKFVAATKVPKAPKKIARVAKQATVQRVSGVKQGIMDLISANAMSSADIIAKSGFKATSVRGTLMTLKKNGLAMNDDGLWIAATLHDTDGGGNSETEYGY